MKRLSLLVGLFLLGVIPACAHTELYEIELSGVTSGNSSPGIGSGLVTVDLDLATMRLEVEFSGLTGTVSASHIHCCTAAPFTGNAGVATPVPTFPGFPSGVTAGSYDMTFDMSAASSFNPSYVTSNGGTTGDAFAALLAGFDGGNAYLNIHTSTFGSGEIRGYLRRIPEPTTAVLALTAFAAFARGRRER